MRFIILLLFLAGCATPSAQPVLHKQLGEKWMLIPKGTRIGNVTTEHAGVYFRADVPVNIFDALALTTLTQGRSQ